MSLPKFFAAKRAFERDYVIAALRAADGNISRAARLAGKDRKDFYDLATRCCDTIDKARLLAGVRALRVGPPPRVKLDDATRKKWGLT